MSSSDCLHQVWGQSQDSSYKVWLITEHLLGVVECREWILAHQHSNPPVGTRALPSFPQHSLHLLLQPKESTHWFESHICTVADKYLIIQLQVYNNVIFICFSFKS